MSVNDGIVDGFVFGGFLRKPPARVRAQKVLRMIRIPRQVG
jgi:hypothetical protein